VNDTSPAADARYHELLRAMAPERRLEAAMRLSRGVREMALAGLRLRHPQADEQELRVRLTVRLYGRAAGVRLFGSVPDNAV
jgi:anti-sigma factor RsiW